MGVEIDDTIIQVSLTKVCKTICTVFLHNVELVVQWHTHVQFNNITVECIKQCFLYRN